MNEKRILQLIGLALRAGKLISGEDQVLDSIRTGKCYLVILAADASENTRKRFQDKCLSYGVKLVSIADRYALGHAIGKAHRVVLGITDTGFAEKIGQWIEVPMGVTE